MKQALSELDKNREKKKESSFCSETNRERDSASMLFEQLQV